MVKLQKTKELMRSALFIILAFGVLLSYGQDSTSFWKEHSEVNGYVKFMQTFSGDGNGNIYDQSLWHNRINTKLYNYTENGGAELYIELRNRLMYGEAIQINPDLGKLMDIDAGVVDLTFVAGEEDKFLFSGIIDRLWYKGYYKNWEWSLGRQRINWGINSYWNANDIFNAFTFTDFDYEERPGSDALRVQKYFNNGVNFEVAASLNSDTAIVAAGKLNWNIWNYDFQVLAGKYYDDIVIGGGWAGGVKKWGFKGETAWFFNPENDNESVGSISVSGEYILKGNQFLGLGALYSSGGVAGGADVSNSLLAFQTSAKALMPTRWSSMATYGGEINGLTSFGIVLVYMPGVDYALLMPSITRSVAQNFDLSFHMINVGGRFNGKNIFLANGFARAKWSF